MLNVVKETARRIALIDIFEELKKDGYKPAPLVRAATRTTLRIMGDLELAFGTTAAANVYLEDSVGYIVLGTVGMAAAYFMDYLVFDQLSTKVTDFDKRMEKYYKYKEKEDDSP